MNSKGDRDANQDKDLKIISEAINEMMYEWHPLYEARKRGKQIPCLTFFLNQNEDAKEQAKLAIDNLK